MGAWLISVDAASGIIESKDVVNYCDISIVQDADFKTHCDEIVNSITERCVLESTRDRFGNDMALACGVEDRTVNHFEMIVPDKAGAERVLEGYSICQRKT